MVIADFIALCIVLGVMGIGGKSLFTSFKRADEKTKAKQAEEAKMRDDLRAALESRKKSKLEDFMVLWGDKIKPEVREHVKQRIDEMFLEENP